MGCHCSYVHSCIKFNGVHLNHQWSYSVHTIWFYMDWLITHVVYAILDQLFSLTKSHDVTAVDGDMYCWQHDTILISVKYVRVFRTYFYFDNKCIEQWMYHAWVTRVCLSRNEYTNIFVATGKTRGHSSCLVWLIQRNAFSCLVSLGFVLYDLR